MLFHAKPGLAGQLLEQDLRTPLPHKLTFAGPAKIVELAVLRLCFRR